MNLDQYPEDSEAGEDFEPESFDRMAGLRLLQPLWNLMFFFGIPPLLGLTLFLVAGVSVAGYYFYGLPADRQHAATNGTIPELPRISPVDHLISELEFSNPNRQLYIISGEIFSLRKRIKSVSQRSDLSDHQRSKLARITLRNEQTLIESQLREKVCREEDLNSFEALAKSFISEDDESLNELAYFALANVRTLKFCIEPTESYGNHLVLGFREFSLGFKHNSTRTSHLLQTINQAKRRHPNNTTIDRVITELGTLLAESQDSSIKKLANDLAEDARFFRLQLLDLNERIRRREDGSLQNFGKVLQEAEKNPEISFKRWTHFVNSCDSLLSIGEYEKFQVANDAISEMIGRLPDSCDFKLTLAAQIRTQRNRLELLGTSITLPEKSLSGRQISATNQDVLLVFLDRSLESKRYYSELKGQSRENYLTILVYRDNFSEKDLELVNFMPLGIKVADHESGSELISSCFIDQYPYTIAVNKQGKIVGINRSLWQAAIAEAFEVEN